MIRLRIKICGLTCPADAAAAGAAGIDLAGFVFAPGSPRRLDPETAARAAAALPEGVRRVGVFVNPSAEEVRRAKRAANLDLLQFHGDEEPGFCRSFGLPFIKAFRVKGAIDLAFLAGFGAEAVLLDAYCPQARGGTGKTFDWDLAKPAVKGGLRVILAGGLRPENVTGALRRVEPWGVDVSSGVEAAPGIKDPGKIREFVAAVRAVEFSPPGSDRSVFQPGR